MVCWAVANGLCGQAANAQVNRPPKIEHGAVTVALTGQPLMIRARITDDSGQVQSATLHYSVSKDAAPFPVPMQSAGASMYVGSIPDSVLRNASALTYYIEAVDRAGVTAETAWYPVKVQITGGKASEPAGGGEKSDRPRWVTPALIAGGAAVVVGGVLLASSSGDDGDSGPAPASTAGTYSGTATTCYQPPGGSQSCSTGPATFVIDEQGGVSSSDLRPGTTLRGTLSGSGFVLTAKVAEPGRSGQIEYIGSVVDGRIAGTVGGSDTTPDGVGTYSGAFSAARK
jgi:hypothetical protein